MRRLLKWTVYLMVFFLISIGIYFYMWWSFEPPESNMFAKAYLSYSTI